MHKLGIRGQFKVVHSDKDGAVKGIYEFPNGVVNAGMNYMLETAFHAGAAITTWNLGLIDNAGFTALSSSDTMASHTGWSEAQGYAEATRPQWTAGTAASRAITNPTVVDFTINATAVIRGIFVTSSSTKGGAVGTLWSTATFASNASVVATDVLKVTYTISG